jgi:hypothetical protein
VGFVVDKVALGQSTKVCLANSHLIDCSTDNPSSRVSTIGKIVVDVPIGLSLTPPQETKTDFQDSIACY